ncbi:antibiotic biosynthesis monooxygenase [Pseudonocardia acaciae]|uniref:antibiotic biosynthesis monooxygenase n=1 Tax=Pseudonocardia acaciae TaxID=551276 RepID=UPI000A04AD64|nr:antibiotic biosynthesis monooxygenase [Pseudonocardia acaciae]
MTSNVPDLDRAGVALVVVSVWELAIPDLQRRLADLAVDTLGPREGLVSHACMLGTDGTTLLHYQQWSDEASAREFGADGQLDWHGAVDEVVPGTVRGPARGYEVYRGRRFAGEAVRTGCVVVVDRLFDRPDRERARRWVDSMFALPEPDAPMPGAIAAHFHLSTDGARAFNFAQWTTERAHRRVSSAAVEELASAREDKPEWRAAESAPGLVRTSFRRYLPYRLR